MFGGRLIPSTLIGVGLSAIFYVIGGAGTALGSLPANADIAFSLLGLAIPIGIGLYKDAKEAMSE